MTARDDERLTPPGAPDLLPPPPPPTADPSAPPTPPSQQHPSPTTRRSGTVIVGSITMLGGAILAIVGSLLPWLSFDGFGDEPNGFETYPVLTDGRDAILWENPGAYVIGAYGVVALVTIIVLAAGKATWSSVCAIIAALVASAASLAAIVAVADVINNFRGLGVGAGIVMVGLAAVVSFVGALIVAIAR